MNTVGHRRGYYRTSSQNDLTRFRRVPGYEGKAGEKKYLEMVNEPARYPETGNQYVGEKEHVSDHRRKTVKRYKRERRGIVSLEERIDEITGGDSECKNRLRSISRKRDISRERKRVMVQLYEEGYTPSGIAHYFNRTPSAVIRAVERISQ